MRIGTSLVLFATGAVLAFAVNLSSRIGSMVVHWTTVGWILMIVGAIGLVMSLIWMSNARRRVVTDQVVTRDRDVVV